jgi:hypothetical protein
MSQHDYIIDNQDGASFRGDINSALAAIATLNSGATAPATTYGGMMWLDTSTGILKQRNSANTAWVTLADAILAGQTINGAVTTTGNVSVGGSLSVGGSTAYSARAWVNFNGTGTVAIRSSGNVSSITDGGVGTYTVNFTNAMPDTNYSVSVTSRRNNSADINFAATLRPTATSGTNYPLTTAGCNISTGTVTNATLIDVDVCCVAVFG